MKTKNALEGLLNPESQQKNEETGSEDGEDEEPKSQASDGALEIEKKDGEEATAAQLGKEKELVDARQTVNKQKAKDEQAKKEQKKVAAAALKAIRDQEIIAEKASLQDIQGGASTARASGMSKRARK